MSTSQRLFRREFKKFAIEFLCLLQIVYGYPLTALEEAASRQAPIEERQPGPITRVATNLGHKAGDLLAEARDTVEDGYQTLARTSWRDAFATLLTIGAYPQAEDRPAPLPPSPSESTAPRNFGEHLLAREAEKGVLEKLSRLPNLPVERKVNTVDAGALPQKTARSSAVAPSSPPKRQAAKNVTPELQALAQSLGNSPAKILALVQDTIGYDPKWGADSPPLGTLWEGMGTSWDQAWLLQELLIAAGVDARLEWGEVEITPEQMVELTGVEDPFRAGDLLTTAGLAVTLVTTGSQVVAVRMPHVWVKAHLDYIPNRGVTSGAGDYWLRMDPTLKRFTVENGVRVDDDVPFVLADHLNSGTELSPRQDHEAALVAHVEDQNLGLATFDELKSLRTLLAEDFPFVPGTLRAKILSIAGESESLPPTFQQRLEVQIREEGGPALLTWTTSLPTIYGQRLEVLWPGATSADQATLDLYGGVFGVEPFEVDLQPALRLDGATVQSGGAIGCAENVTLTATLTAPNGLIPGVGNATVAEWSMYAGEHGVLALDPGHMPQEVIDLFETGRTATADPLEEEGWALALAGARYLRAVGEDLDHLTALRWQRPVNLGAAVLAVQRGAVSTAPDGTPLTFSPAPLALDLGARPLGLFPAVGRETSTVPTLEMLGSQSSFREGEALAATFGGEHVTAVTFLTRAARAGQTLTQVDTSNLEAALATADLSSDARFSVRAGVENGLIAWIPEKQLTINGWDTTGYILEDPTTGAGAYLVTFERLLAPLEGVVTFHNPIDLSVITAPTDVVATLEAEGIENWSLSTRPTGEAGATLIASGTGSVTNAVLGQFDPTLLLNGMHELVLTGRNAEGRPLTGKVDVVVEGNMKIGHFTLSFIDLAIPLSGLDIEVIRTYDSRQRNQQGDFGYGWTLDIRQGSYRNNRPPGDGWRIPATSGPWGLPCSTVQETKSHLTTVRLSDQEVYRFRLVLDRPATVLGGCYADAVFEWVDGPLPGTTLEILGSNQVFVANGSDRAVVPDTQEPFIPQDVKLKTRDGRIFHLDLATGVTHLEDLNGNTLEITPDGITHSSGKGVDFERDVEGRIVTITDPMGNANRYAYDGEGDLTTFTDRVDAETRFTYGAGHYLEDVENALGVRAVRTEYDSEGRVARMLDADGKVIALDHDLTGRREVVTNRLGHVRILEYDNRGNVIREVDELGHVTRRTFDGDDRLLTLTDPLGNILTNTYDTRGDLTSVTDPLGNITQFTYDDLGNPTSVTDVLGQVSTFTFDTQSNLTTATDPLGNITQFTYDTRGLLLTETDALGQVTSYGYTADGLPETLTDALGVTTTTTYDANGNATQWSSLRTLADGTVEEVITGFTVDALGRVLDTTDATGAITSTTYDALGRPLTSSDALGRITTNTYDGLGQLLDTTYPDGTSEAWTYDAEGRLSAVIDRGGRTTSFAYDATGRLLETLLPDGSVRSNTYDAAGRLTASTDALGHTTTATYDAIGRLLTTTDPLGNTTSRTLNALGRATAITDALGFSTGFEYDSLGRLIETNLADGSGTHTELDALGRPLAEIDAAGVRTEFHYDSLGRLLTVKDALDGMTRFTYNEQGQRISQTDALGRTTRFEHDAVGRPTARILPDGAVERFTYDAVGNLISRTDFGGSTTTYAYDSMDRLLRRNQPDGVTVRFTYTATGQRESMVDPQGTTTYAYDVRDRRTSMTTPEGWTLRNQWDAEDQRTALVLDLGNPAQGGLGVHTTATTYDAAGRIHTVTDARGGVTTHNHDARGQLISLIQPGGVLNARSYNPAGRLLSLTTTNVEGEVLQGYQYSLDITGRRESVTEHDGTHRAWTYDILGRLNAERVTDAAEALIYEHRFEYDAVGNRLVQERLGTGGSLERIDYQYDNRDRLLSETVLGIATNWTWDAAGNPTSTNGPEGTITYGWDSENRLIQTDLPDGSSLVNLYDGDGVLLGRTLQEPGEAATTRSLLVDTTEVLSQVVAEFEDGALTRQYTRGDRLLGILGAGEQQAVHVDGLGSVRVLSDGSGTVTGRQNYEAFGRSIEASGSSVSPFGFAGEYFDDTLGLAHHRARWMDPGSGRFLGMDPFLGDQKLPLSLHRYLYAHASPISLMDPTGLFASATEVTAVASIRTGVAGIQGNFGFAFINAVQTGGKLGVGRILFSLATGIIIGVAGFAMVAFAQSMKRGFISGRLEILIKMRRAKKGDKSAAGEIRAAMALRSQGRNVHFRQAAGDKGVEGKRTSDFLVGGLRGTGLGGKRYEVFTPQTNKPSKVASKIGGKGKQAERFIIDLDGGTSLKEGDFDNFLYRVNNIPGKTTQVKEIIFVRGGEVVRVLK